MLLQRYVPAGALAEHSWSEASVSEYIFLSHASCTLVWTHLVSILYHLFHRSGIKKIYMMYLKQRKNGFQKHILDHHIPKYLQW